MLWGIGLFLIVVALLFFFWFFPVFFHGIPWQPTDMKRVRRMLEMAEVKPDEVVYDLGCGDGRIIICAAREFGARAVGVELNPWLYFLALVRVWIRGLSRRVKVIFGNLHQVDLKEADVVTIFLYSHVNDLLQEKFQRELKPGARIVSYVWVLKNWKPVAVDSEHDLYLYVKNGADW